MVSGVAIFFEQLKGYKQLSLLFAHSKIVSSIAI